MDKSMNVIEGIEKIEKTSELGYMFWSVLCGVIMTIAYDFLRARRREKSVPAIFVYLEDTAWFAALGIIMYVLAFKENSGMVRWYSFLGVGLGALIYKLLFGDMVMQLLRKAYGLFIRGICFAIKIILFPLNLLLKTVRRPIRVVVWHTRESSKVFDTYGKILKAKIENRIRIKPSLKKHKGKLKINQ